MCKYHIVFIWLKKGIEEYSPNWRWGGMKGNLLRCEHLNIFWPLLLGKKPPAIGLQVLSLVSVFLCMCVFM